MKVGDKVKIVDKYDMNFRSVGYISKRQEEYDTLYEGIEYKMVKVDFGKQRIINGKKIYVPNEVPYAMHQLKIIK
jgi:hypothetical protein